MLILLFSLPTAIPAYSKLLDDPSSIGEGGEPFVEDSPRHLAEGLLFILEASHAEVRATLDRLCAEGMEISDSVEELLLLGEESAREALLLFAEGNYQSSVEKATEALLLYRDALLVAFTGEQAELPVDASLEAVSLRDAIERANQFLLEVGDTLSQLDLQGIDVSRVEVLLGEAVESLRLAEELLDDGECGEAGEELNRSLELLSQAMSLLEGLNDLNTKEKASKFISRTEERLQKLEDRVSYILGYLHNPFIHTTEIQQLFNETDAKKMEIEASLEEGELGSALDGLDGIVEDADTVLDILEDLDKELARDLRTIERLEAKKSHLEEKIGSLEERGVDITRLEGELHEAAVLLEEAVTTLQVNIPHCDNELIDEAEDLVEEIDESVDVLEESLQTNDEDDPEDDEAPPDEDRKGKKNGDSQQGGSSSEGDKAKGNAANNHGDGKRDKDGKNSPDKDNNGAKGKPDKKNGNHFHTDDKE